MDSTKRRLIGKHHDTTPWVGEVAHAGAHPDADLGLHLTLTSEWETYRWAAASNPPTRFRACSIRPVPFQTTIIVAAKAKPADVEREIRAQVVRAPALGIHPRISIATWARFTPRLMGIYARLPAVSSALSRSRGDPRPLIPPLSETTS
jgi:hypothetical protein